MWSWRLKRILGTTALGTPASNIKKLNSHKLRASYSQGTLDDIQQNLWTGNPCIVFVRTDEISHWESGTDHALVIVGIDDEFVYVNDPYFESAPIPVLIGEFMIGWIERQQYFSTITKT